jgi:hypothetical protein
MRRPTALLLAPLLVVCVACGGGSSRGGATSDAKASASAGDARSSVFCKRATTIDRQFTDLEKTFSGSAVPSGVVFEKAATAIDDLVKVAPATIKADLKTVAAGVRTVATALSGINLSDPKAMSDPANAAKLQAASSELSKVGADVQAASTRVSTYMSSQCGIDIGATSSTSTTLG